jgi:DNA processing protein
LTADFAVEQNREVFAVPGNITSPGSLGTNALIKQGANVITNPEDILTELQPKLQASARSASAQQVRALQLDADERHILNALHYEPRHIDWISHTVKMPSSKVLSLLLMLELKSLVKQEAGKMFLRL